MLESKRMISLLLLCVITLTVICGCLFVAPRLTPEQQKQYDELLSKKQANPKVIYTQKGVAIITSYYNFYYDGNNFYDDIFPDLELEIFKKMLTQTDQYDAKWVIGAIKTFRKPFDINELLAVVNRVLG